MENVNHPKHYNEHPSGVECIEIARHYCFSIGNAIKYLWRAGLKKDASLTDTEKEIEDLKKAIWYIQDRINELENLQKKEQELKEIYP
jgi:cell shape-determining protein MreC